MQKKTPFKFVVIFDESGNIPDEIHVIPVGEWDHPAYGHMEISELDLAEFVRNFDAGVLHSAPFSGVLKQF